MIGFSLQAMARRNATEIKSAYAFGKEMDAPFGEVEQKVRTEFGNEVAYDGGFLAT